MTTFIINEQTITLNMEDTMLHLKNLIIDKFKLDCEYVDLEFIHDKPIRGFGKMNLEPGILPRTMDNFPFNRYSIEGKNINCKFIPVKDYLPNVKKISENPDSIYKPPGMKTNISDSKKNSILYDLNSNSDFPALC